MIETQVMPYGCKVKGERRTIVDAYAPSLDMVPGAFTVRAMRIEPNRYEVWYVPQRWYNRKIKVDRLENAPIRWLIQHHHFNYFRRATVAATIDHINEPGIFGPDVFVCGYELLDRNHASTQLNRVVRHVYYLRAEPGDGLTVPPDSTCVALHGGEIRRRRPAQMQLDYARKTLLRYLEQVTAHAQGRTELLPTGKWVTSEEQKKIYADLEERSRLHRIATGG